MLKKKPTERQEMILAGLYLEREKLDENALDVEYEIELLHQKVRRLVNTRNAIIFNHRQIEEEMKELRNICGWGDR